MLSLLTLRMHIPDGFLSVPVALLFWIPSIILIAIALHRVSQAMGEREAPLMGVLAAALFAGQMLNFSIATGTSGHLLGAALAAILLGPWAAVIVMTCVVSLQALVFQDGGLLTLGANLFNMAVVGVFVAYAIYRTVLRLAGKRSWSLFLAAGLAAWFSIVLSALSAGLQLALSGTSPANLAIPAMGGVHMLIGLGEAGITLGALAFLKATRPDLLSQDRSSASGLRSVWIGGLGLALVLAIASPLASAKPDGLMWIAQQQGFASLEHRVFPGLLPHYTLPGISNAALGTILAAVVGILAILGAAWWVSSIRRGKTKDGS